MGIIDSNLKDFLRFQYTKQKFRFFYEIVFRFTSRQINFKRIQNEFV